MPRENSHESQIGSARRRPGILLVREGGNEAVAEGPVVLVGQGCAEAVGDG